MGLRRRFSKIFKWSGRRGSNSRRQPWEGCILPLNYVRICYAKDYSTIMLFLGIKFLINQIKNLFFRTGLLKTGAEGFEPPEWLDQNQLPYHLATPHCVCDIFHFINTTAQCQVPYLGTYIANSSDTIKSPSF